MQREFCFVALASIQLLMHTVKDALYVKRKNGEVTLQDIDMNE